MKKKISILILLIAVVGLLSVCYIIYGRTKANEYVMFLKSITKISNNKLEIKDDVKVEKIIKQTPTNLVVLIKWGDNEKAYMSINNWITKAHDHIELDVVDKEKSRIMYQLTKYY